MSSQAQVDANRANSQHSTGPRTEAGKAIASLNARRDGVYSKFIEFRSEEERDTYDRILDGLLDAWTPANGGESATVYAMARARFWRLRLELALEQEWNKTLDAEGMDALAGDDAAKEARLARRLRSVKTDYNQALSELKHLQRQRQLREAAEAMAVQAAAGQAAAALATAPATHCHPASDSQTEEIGSVPAGSQAVPETGSSST